MHTWWYALILKYHRSIIIMGHMPDPLLGTRDTTARNSEEISVPWSTQTSREDRQWRIQLNKILHENEMQKTTKQSGRTEQFWEDSRAWEELSENYDLQELTAQRPWTGEIPMAGKAEFSPGDECPGSGTQSWWERWQDLEMRIYMFVPSFTAWVFKALCSLLAVYRKI